MRKSVLFATLATLMMAPVQAAEWQNQSVDTRPGVYIGGRVHMSLGGKAAARPRALLSLAPMLSRTSTIGIVRTNIGEGLALNFGQQSKPTLTLAGVRADQALGLSSGPTTNHGSKSGMSDGAKVAIGVGVGLALVVGGGFLYLSSRCTECDQ